MPEVVKVIVGFVVLIVVVISSYQTEKNLREAAESLEAMAKKLTDERGGGGSEHER